jgi:endonuclease/exonuclease/phosphatase family metal-dependent hydrolase
MIVILLWWALGRITAPSRRLTVHSAPAAEVGAGTPAGVIRVLAWNIAHGRGDVHQGLTDNWRGGTREERLSRLFAIAEVIREADADLVILNEVDFASSWSHEVNQAEVLARVTGYPTWIEQRNYEIHLPFWQAVFGNALLSRMPVEEAEWLAIPPHSSLEALGLGAKSAAVVRLDAGEEDLALVPVHMEYRSRSTRLEALPALRRLKVAEGDPVVLAGDFNSAPRGWPGVGAGTLLDSLMAMGWTSPRASGSPREAELTFPTVNPTESRDWILVEAPLRVSTVRVLHSAAGLSDHAPVLAVVELQDP